MTPLKRENLQGRIQKIQKEGAEETDDMARAASFRVGGLKGKQVKINQLGGSEDMLPKKILILTPLKCRVMRLKLINEILKYKLSWLKKR